MKKRKRLLPFFLGIAMLCADVSAVPLKVCAEEAQEEEYSEESAEHQPAYYEEIQTNAIKGWPQGDAVESDAALVMDAGTGAILYAKNIDRKEYPASITKIMTVLLALENGNLDDIVTFSANAVYSIEFGSSHLGLTEGEQLTMEDCLYGIMLQSANEISNAVAEHIGGDIDTFVKMMNDRAKELGCTGTHFANVHGLHEEDHYVTAHDMALIMREALKNEKFREIIGTVEYSYDETNLVDEKRYFMNHHKMIWEDGMVYDGCLGGKTGFTDDAWNTLVTAAKRGEMELICVVLRVPGLVKSYEETKTLLDYGFDNFTDQQVANTELTPDTVTLTGIEDPAELEKIKAADFREEPFVLPDITPVTVPNGMDVMSFGKTMDFAEGRLTWVYEGMDMGSTPFGYTGQWEKPTEAPTEAVTEATTESTEESLSGSVMDEGKGFLGTVTGIYDKMDSFIKENTVLAALMGAVLLFIFVPLLLVAVNRNRKYKKIMELREEEMKLRRRLEEEIERKSAAQIEAELRAEDLRQKLLEEQKKRIEQEEAMKEIENAKGFYLDEEEAPTQDASKEEAADEYVEIPVEEIEQEIR